MPAGFGPFNVEGYYPGKYFHSLSLFVRMTIIEVVFKMYVQHFRRQHFALIQSDTIKSNYLSR